MNIELGYSVYYACTLLFLAFMVVIFNPDKIRKLGGLKFGFGRDSSKVEIGVPSDSNIGATETTGSSKKKQALIASNEAEEPHSKDIAEEKSSFFALQKARNEGDLEVYKRIANELLSDESFGDSPFWRSLFMIERHYLNDSTALEALVSYSNDEQNSFWPPLFLARYYLKKGDKSDAKKLFATAITRSKSLSEPTAIIEYADFLETEESKDSAIELLAKAYQNAENDEAKGNLAKAIGEHFVETGDKVSAAYWLHLSAINKLTDFQHRFDIAFYLAEHDIEPLLVLKQYTEISARSPQTSYTLNNLAVQIGEDNAPVAYVEHLERATKYTKVFSLANLALHASRAGLIEVANSYLDKISDSELEEASDSDRAHVLQARSAIVKQKKNSEEYVEQQEKLAGKIERHYSLSSTYCTKHPLNPNSLQIVGNWHSKDGKHQVEISEAKMGLLTIVSVKIKSPDLTTSSTPLSGDLQLSRYAATGTVKPPKSASPTALTSAFQLSWNINVSMVGENEISVLTKKGDPTYEVNRHSLYRVKET